MGIKSRAFQGFRDFRYGFNGQEKDDEVSGAGNSYDYGARIYDPRIGRWLSIDPMFGKYADVSPYAFALNNPIYFKDYGGKDIVPSYNVTYNTTAASTPFLPQKASDLGNTTKAYDYSISETGKVDFLVRFDIALSPIFKSGHPYFEDFKSDNPNKHEIVGLHEYGHAQQYLEILKTSTFIVKVDGVEIQGTVDEVLNAVSAMKKEEFIKANGLVDDNNQGSFDMAVGIAVQSAFTQITDQVETKFHDKYPITEEPSFSLPAENDANNRAAEKAADFEIEGGQDQTVFPDYSGYEEPQ